MHEKTKQQILWVGAIGGIIFTAGMVLNFAAGHSKKVAAFMQKLRGA